jgi:UDP-glucose 4-epimerase
MSGDSQRFAMAGRPRVVFITGGTGFVMSNLALRLVASDPSLQVVMLDVGSGDAIVEEHLAEYADRITYVQGDVRDRAVLDAVAASHVVTHGVHATAVNIATDWEIERPTWYIDVNIMGTANMVDWARRLPGLERFLYISSGAVYGYPTPESPHGLQA